MTWNHAVNGFINLSPSSELVCPWAKLYILTLSICALVLPSFPYCLLPGSSFCFVWRNKAVWKRQKLGVNRCKQTTTQFCGVHISLTADLSYSHGYVEGTYNFDTQMKRKMKKNDTKWLMLNFVFWSILISFWVYFAVPPWGHFKL